MITKVIDQFGSQVYLGFTLEELPRKGDIVQNANGLQFEVEAVLHRKHDEKGRHEHVVEVVIGDKL